MRNSCIRFVARLIRPAELHIAIDDLRRGRPIFSTQQGISK